jgi:hypothetical protein
METKMSNRKKFFKQIENNRKLMRHHPTSWNIDEDITEIIDFRNVQHFKHTMGLISQKNDNLLGVSYKDALDELKRENGLILGDKYKTVEQYVKENLIAKNLITKDAYKGVTYSHEGENIDMLKFLEGDPNCYIVPKPNEKIHFYELYIDSTVSHCVEESDYMNNVAKLLATIKLLEKRQIFIKINMVIKTKGSGNNNTVKRDLLVIVPVFSHRENKNIDRMSSVINLRFLRKFGFAIIEAIYGDNVASGYGIPEVLKQTIKLDDKFDETKFAEEVINNFITKCEME